MQCCTYRLFGWSREKAVYMCKKPSLVYVSHSLR